MQINSTLKVILATLLKSKTIGGKHTPEHKLITFKTKYLTKQEKRDFEKEYSFFVKNFLIIRVKKRTKKSYDWHISLNPRKIKEIKRLLENEGQ